MVDFAWVDAVSSVVVVFAGRQENILSRDDAMAAIGSQAKDDPLLGNFDLIWAVTNDEGLSVRLELTREEEPQTRLQVRHPSSEVLHVLELGRLMRRLSERKWPKAVSTGLNFSRILVDPEGSRIDAYLSGVARSAGLPELMGTPNATVLELNTRGGEGPNQVALRLRQVHGDGFFGGFRGIHADCNFSMESPTKRKIREIIAPERLREHHAAFNEITDRIDRAAKRQSGRPKER